MNVRFSKWGNSIALRIPNGLAKELKVSEGSAADLQVTEGTLVVTPVDAVSKYDVNALVEAITAENLHGEVDTGRPVGNETV
jgi:antitoxin MazE